jgi:hypothetical protein
MKFIRSIDRAIDRAVEYRPYWTATLLISGVYLVQFFLGGSVR